MTMLRSTIRVTVMIGAVAGAGEAGAAGAPQSLPPAVQAAEMPAKGDVIRSFEAATIDGGTKFVSFEKGSTVLLFFLSGCPTCHKMIPEWNRVYQQSRAGVTVLGVLMDQEPPGFFVATPISFPVVRSPGRAFLQSLKITRAPLTLRVGRGGKVEDAAMGLVDPLRLDELFASVASAP
jgi:hypothetical protein